MAGVFSTQQIGDKMDPDVTLAMIRESFASGNYLSAGIAFAALDTWIASGGFMPQDWQVETKVPQ